MSNIAFGKEKYARYQNTIYLNTIYQIQLYHRHSVILPIPIYLYYFSFMKTQTLANKKIPI